MQALLDETEDFEVKKIAARLTKSFAHIDIIISSESESLFSFNLGMCNLRMWGMLLLHRKPPSSRPATNPPLASSLLPASGATSW